MHGIQSAELARLFQLRLDAIHAAAKERQDEPEVEITQHVPKDATALEPRKNGCQALCPDRFGEQRTILCAVSSSRHCR
jgi:hypothetical protein